MTTECRSAVEGLAQLKAGLELPAHLSASEPYRLEGDFDPNQYFTVLTHLKLAPGYVLDFLYFSDKTGGTPLVYARKSGDAPYTSYADFLASFGEEVTDETAYGTLGHAYDFLQQVQANGSPESYFEHVTLAYLGAHFYLQGNSRYYDTVLLCGSDLQAVEDEVAKYGLELPAEVKEQAAALDFTPLVKMGEGSVTVRTVTFTKWGGFYESVYILNKYNPAEILDVEHRQLIEYDCGLRF